MRIFNEEKTKELQENELDYSLGCLIDDKLFIKTIPHQPEIQEKFHYETIRVYENGSRDVDKVIDIPYQPEILEHDEYEDILVFKYYNEEELKEIRKNEIQIRLDKLTQDFIQMHCGAVFEDKEERIKEFQTLHNEKRVLLGKEPRIYKELEQ